MITIPEYNKITHDDDISMVNAKLNAIGKAIKDVTVDDYCDCIRDLIKSLPPNLILEEQIIAKDFMNVIAVRNSIQSLIDDKCISVIRVSLKVSRKV